MNADVFATKALRAVARDEAIIVVPAWWKAFWYLERLSPALSARVWESFLGRMRAELKTVEAMAPAKGPKPRTGSGAQMKAPS